jgi:phosphate transport system substrate-binding protein
VVPFVNLPGVQANQLRLTSELVVDIFLGKLTRWNDPRLAAQNDGLRLPDLPVMPVHRSNVSGTTFMFTTYLLRVSDAWRDGPRAGTTVQWPVGAGEANRDAVLAKVRGTPGAISYMEAHFARADRLATALLRNRAGAFVSPDNTSFAKAAAAADWTPANFIVEMVDLDAEGAWPIVSPTFIFMPTNPAAEKVAASRNTMKFFDWAFRNAAAPTAEIGFVPLPAAVQASVHEAWRRVKGPDGQPVWEA